MRVKEIARVSAYFRLFPAIFAYFKGGGRRAYLGRSGKRRFVSRRCNRFLPDKPFRQTASSRLFPLESSQVVDFPHLTKRSAV